MRRNRNPYQSESEKLAHIQGRWNWKGVILGSIITGFSAVLAVVIAFYLPQIKQSNNIEENENFNLGLEQLIRSDHKSAFINFNTAAEAGYIDAYFFLGYLYAYGAGIPIDTNEAMKYYRLGVDKGDLKANYGIADFIVNANDEDKATPYYLKAFNSIERASNNNPFWKLVLSSYYIGGKGVDTDTAIGIKILLEVCKENENFHSAHSLLATYYFFIEDYQNSILWAEKVFNNNNTSIDGDLEYILGKSYALHNKRYSDAIRLLNLSAQKKNLYAAYELGYMFENGIGVEKNIPKAIEYYEYLDKKGLDIATVSLGQISLNLYKDTANYYFAIYKAASKKYYPAYYLLGDYYYSFLNKKDSALLFLREAANQNLPYAEYALGNLSETENDKSYWHKRALSHGYKIDSVYNVR